MFVPDTHGEKPEAATWPDRTDETVFSLIDAGVLRDDGVLHQDPEEDLLPDPGRSQIASEKKNLEQWQTLWDQWDEIVSEVGDEHGRYAEQDEEWHPPYFVNDLFANDLEVVAKKMLELIDEIFVLVDEPELFRDAIEEIGDNINSYPEWMGVEDSDGCILEKQTSLCILRWAWLACAEAEDRGGAFLEKVNEVETDHELVSMDNETIWRFFTSLPDEVCRGIYTALTKNPTEYKVDKIHAIWHRIFHEYEKKYDTASYLNTCREHLAENWRYGAPLIEDALESGDYEAAENYLGHTFAALLREGEKKWLPESKLLIGIFQFIHEPTEGGIVKLLETWEQVADKLNLPARKAAVSFQKGTFQSQENWEVVIDLYQSLSSPETQDALEPLFDSWKKEMVRRSTNYYFKAYSQTDNWVYWLLEAQTGGSGNGSGFIDKIKTWLALLDKDLKNFEKDIGWLALFTKDVPGGDELAKKYPSFFQAAIFRGSYNDTILSRSRQKTLEKLDAGQCIPLAMSVWTRYLVSMVPDPSEARGGNYEVQVLWINALYEVNPKDYKLLLANWRKTHKLKRNLWRDMKARNLPL